MKSQTTAYLHRFATIAVVVLTLLAVGDYLPSIKSVIAKSIRTIVLIDQVDYDRLHNGSVSASGWTSFAGQGVQLRFGDFTMQAVDASLPGRGISFSFGRTYHSALDDGLLGPGWTHTYAMHLMVEGPDTVLISMPDGRLDRYSLEGDAYTPPPGVHHDLFDNGDGTYTLITKSQQRYEFDANGQLENIVDLNDNQIGLTYDGNGNLVSITDTVDRDVTLSYDGLNHLTQLLLPDGRTVDYAYDTGRLQSVTDPGGNATTFGYDANGRLSSVTDANGHTQITNAYDAEGHVQTQTDALGNETVFSYDDVTDETAVTDPRSATTIYRFDSNHRLVEIEDALAQMLSRSYDDHNNLLSSTDRRGSTTTYEYDDAGNSTKMTDALGNIIRTEYDGGNRPVRTTDPLGRKTEYSYDANGNLVGMTDARGYDSSYAYDAFGQPTSFTDANGETTGMTYDGQGNLVTSTDALDNTSSMSYDSVGRLLSQTGPDGATSTFSYDVNDRVTEMTDALGAVTTFTYDAVGNRLSVTDPLGRVTENDYNARNELIEVTNAEGHASTFAYDANGNRTSTTNPAGETTKYAYDELNRLSSMEDPTGDITQHGYDANGNRTTITDQFGKVTTFTYDALNRQISTTDSLGSTSQTEYDAAGNIIRRVDAEGKETTFEYNATNQLRSVTDADVNTVTYYYDGVGNRIAVVNPGGSVPQEHFDALGRVVEKKDPLGNITQYTYDEAGNLVAKTDANGQTSSYEYDDLGRLVKAIYPDNSITYHYDAVGNRTHVIDIQGVTLYDYDDLNRITQVTNPNGQTVGYEYDALGRRSKLIYPSGQAVDYSYDADGRLETVTDWDGNTTSYDYDARGQLHHIYYPNGTTVTYAYDDAGRLTDITHPNGLFIHYELDANGNRTSMTDDRGTESYSYDDLNRLIEVTYADGETVSYTYDGNGNRLTMNSTVHGLTTYSYNEADQLLSMTNPDSSDTEFTYDLNGNMTSKGDVQYLFDSANRLTQVIDGEATVSFAYDGDGNRLRKSVNGESHRYAMDLNTSLPKVLVDRTDNDDTAYTYGHELNSLSDPNNGWLYYHSDGLGSVRSLSGDGGGEIENTKFDVFGTNYQSSYTSNNMYSYTGEQFDNETNLYYLRARYYDPQIGRFISSDTFPSNSRSQQQNRYTYVENNPTNSVDPSGLTPEINSCFEWSLYVPGCNPHDGTFCDVECNAVTDSNCYPVYFNQSGGNGAFGYTGRGYVECWDYMWVEVDTSTRKFISLSLDVLSFFEVSKGKVGAVARLLEGLGIPFYWEGLNVAYDASKNDTAEAALGASAWWAGEVLGPFGDAWAIGVDVGSSFLFHHGRTCTFYSSDSTPVQVLNHPRLGYAYARKGVAHTNASGSVTDPNSGVGAESYTIHILSPDDHALLRSSSAQLRVRTSGNVQKVNFSAYYATDPYDINTTAWRHIGWAERVGDTWVYDWDISTIPDQHNAGWSTVGIAAHYYTCDGDPGSSCDHVGDQVNVAIERGALSWDFGNDSQGWSLVNGSNAGFDGRAWKFEPGNDPQIVSPEFRVDARQYNAVEVILDSKAENTNARLYFKRVGDDQFIEARSADFTLLPNDDYRGYRIYLGNNPDWSGYITHLRLDPVADGDAGSRQDFVYIDQIKFFDMEGYATTEWLPDGSLIKGSNETVYLLEDGVQRPFTSYAIFQSCRYNDNLIHHASDDLVDSYADGVAVPICSGALVKGTGSTVFLVDGIEKRAFCSEQAFLDMGYDWGNILIVPNKVLNEISDGADICDPLPNPLTHPNGTVIKLESDGTIYALENGAKRPFSDASALNSWGWTFDDVVEITQAEFDAYPTGDNMNYRDGSLIKGSRATVYAIEDGKKRPFPTAADFEAFGYRWGNVLEVDDTLLGLAITGYRLRTDPLMITSGLSITPDWPAIDQSTLAAFNLTNTGNKAVFVQATQVQVDGTNFLDQFGGSLQPDDTLIYSQSQAFSDLGTKEARARYKRSDIWHDAYPAWNSTSATAGFTVMTIAAPVMAPIQNDDRDGAYTITWSTVDGATSYRLQEDDNPDFSSPTIRYEGSGTDWSTQGHAAGTFYYRVQVRYPEQSGWSSRNVIVDGEPTYHGWHPDGTLLKSAQHPEVMLLEDDERRRFPNESVYFSHYPSWEPISEIQQVEYDQYPEGAQMTFRNGTIIKNTSNATVYVIENNKKRGFCSDETYDALGLSWDNIMTVPSGDMPATGAEICLTSLRFEGGLVKKDGDQTVYRLLNGQKRPFNSWNAFHSHGYLDTQIAIIDPAELSSYPVGNTTSLRNGTIIRKGRNGEPADAAYWIMSGGKKRQFGSWDEYLGLGYNGDKYMLIPESEFNNIPTGSAIPSGSYHVTGAFVKYDNDATVYIIEGGKKRPFSEQKILDSYGTGDGIFIAEVNSSNYWRLNYWSTGDSKKFREGTLLRTPSDGYFAIDSDERRRFWAVEALEALGYQLSDALYVSSTLVSPIPIGPDIMLKSLLVEGALIKSDQDPATFWRVENEQRYGFSTWEVYQSWGYDGDDAALLPEAERAHFSVGPTFKFRDGSLLKEQNDATVYVVEHQQKRGFPTMDVFLEYGYEGDDIQVVPDGALDIMPEGPIMDIGSPSPISVVINDGDQYTNDNDVTVSVHATDFSSGVKYVWLSNNANWQHVDERVFSPAEGDFQKDISWDLNWESSTDDGLKKVYVRFLDAQRYESDAISAEITLDTSPPSGTYTSPANDALVRDEVSLAVNTQDNGSGIKYVEFKAFYDGEWHTLHKDFHTPYEFLWNASGVDDQADILLGGIVVDNYGRSGDIPTIAISKDGTPPRAIICPTGCAVTSNSLTAMAMQESNTNGFVVDREFIRDSVLLSLEADDNLAGVERVDFEGFYDGIWHLLNSDMESPYEYEWSVTGIGDQEILVRAQVPDTAGNNQELPDVRLVKDTVIPSLASDLAPEGWDEPFTNDTTPAFGWTPATDDSSGVGGYILAIDDWTPDENDWILAGVNAWSVTDPLTDGDHFVTIATLDKAGNVNPEDTNNQGDAPYYQFTIDTVAPSSVVAALGTEQTDISFQVSWSGSDDRAGVVGYDVQFRDNNGPWLDWLVNTSQENATFRGEDGHEYGFRSRAIDSAGNAEDYPAEADATTSIDVPKVPPAVVENTTIAIDNDNTALSWTAVTVDEEGNNISVDHYNIYRSDSPYFTPDASSLLGTSNGLSYTDTDAPKLPDTSYFYVVAAVGQGGQVGAHSDRIGSFNLGLTSGE